MVAKRKVNAGWTLVGIGAGVWTWASPSPASPSAALASACGKLIRPATNSETNAFFSIAQLSPNDAPDHSGARQAGRDAWSPRQPEFSDQTCEGYCRGLRLNPGKGARADANFG